MRTRIEVGRTLRAAVLMLLIAGSGTGFLHAEESAGPETRDKRDARMKWWREAKFGLFIHWGIYSVPAGTYQGKQIPGIGEWIMNRGKIPVAEYGKFAGQFNPVKFDADEWVRTAKEAGQKYIVITSKHHDGFAMFCSKASPYNICDATPFKRDPLKELAEACRKHGLKLGFYYSQAQDWHHPGGAAAGGHWDKAQDGSFDDYLDKVAVPEVREILSNYGDVAVLWWDTPVDMTKERAEKLLPLLKLQPHIITNNRLGGGYAGDTETPEQFIPATGYPGRDWETCMTMNDTWGFKSYDHNWKSTRTLLRNLIDVASKGGNYLLNVGPTSEGQIPQPSVERLKEMGAWLKVNGDAIYGTKASPFRRLPFEGRCTRKPEKLFLHIFDWPADRKLLLPIHSEIKSAYLLPRSEEKLQVEKTGQGLMLHLPEVAPDPNATVIAVEIEGELQTVPVPVLQAADSKLKLEAEDADIAGKSLKLEQRHGHKMAIVSWSDASDQVSWPVRLSKPGTFEVEASVACPPGSEGSTVVFTISDQAVTASIPATKSGDDFTRLKLGRIKVEKPGDYTATIKATKKGKGAVANLESVTLEPAK